MSEQNKALEYDDGAAVEFIHNYIPQDLKEKFPDDTLYYILDLICEFYEETGYLSEEDEEKEEKELISFIVQQSKKNAIGNFKSKDILLILRAEDAYMNTLDDEESE